MAMPASSPSSTASSPAALLCTRLTTAHGIARHERTTLADRWTGRSRHLALSLLREGFHYLAGRGDRFFTAATLWFALPPGNRMTTALAAMAAGRRDSRLAAATKYNGGWSSLFR
jgi:hypothetical protein